jgi:hypothetical protein
MSISSKRFGSRPQKTYQKVIHIKDFAPDGNELNVRIKHMFKSQGVFIDKLNRIG